METRSDFTAWLVSLAALVLVQTGCMTYANKTIPAARLPDCLKGESRTAKCPVNLAALRQTPPKQHVIGAGDLLGIQVRGVLPASSESPPVMHAERFQNNNYYPPGGLSNAPSMGVPVTVQPDGKLYLPLVDPIDVRNLTIQQAAEKVVAAYSAEEILQPGREQVYVSLIKPRTYRVMVVREDTPGSPTLMTRQQVALTKMGSGTLIDLPAFENDVLHALTATGGMPGIDAHNCIWILRSRNNCADVLSEAAQQMGPEANPEVLLASCDTEYTRTMIPLRVSACQGIPFTPQDVILNDGDVVYVEPRVADQFYTGGLLPAGQFPLPRDHDVDILEAIAIATGGVGAPASGANGVQNVLRQGAGPGNILIPPARAIVLRKLADGRQVRIRVDLRKALHDSSERLRILPDDFVMLQFTPGQQISNTWMNWFNWNLTTVPTQLGND